MAYTLKIRGAGGGTIQHEYLCPAHGRFTADVPRDNVPDEVACPSRSDEVKDGWFRDRLCRCAHTRRDHLNGRACLEGCGCREFELASKDGDGNYCGLTSPWSPSSIACKVALAGFSRGKAEAPPTPHALTTRDLAEGMPLNEWKAKRAKLREERRRKRIREMRG